MKKQLGLQKRLIIIFAIFIVTVSILQTVLAGGENSSWRERFAELEEKEKKAEQAKREEEKRLRQEKENKEKLRQKEIERLSPRAEKDAELHRSLTELSARGYTMTTAFNQHITFDSGNRYRVEYRIYSKEVKLMPWNDMAWVEMRHYIVFWDEDGYLTSVDCVFEREEKPEYLEGNVAYATYKIEYYPMSQGENVIDQWIAEQRDPEGYVEPAPERMRDAAASHCIITESREYEGEELNAYLIEQTGGGLCYAIPYVSCYSSYGYVNVVDRIDRGQE